MSTPLDLVIAWHDAVRKRDLVAVAALVHSDVEVGGPKGSGQGLELMTDWVQRSGIVLEIESFLQRGLTFVVAQVASWPDPLAEDGRTEPVAVASVISVSGTRISRVLRFDDVDARRPALECRRLMIVSAGGGAPLHRDRSRSSAGVQAHGWVSAKLPTGRR